VLRVLEEQSFERVGGSQAVEVDVRVVAATHRNLEEEVREGCFREDLYYRLKVVQVERPPLRERGEDLPSLSDRFLGQVAERLDREKKNLSPKAMSRLLEHSWPGNVRELRNVLEQASVLSSGDEIDVSDLQLGAAPVRTTPSPAMAAIDAEATFADAKKQMIENFERQFLMSALDKNDGNVSQTARDIGMVRQSLQQKIRDLDLRDEQNHDKQTPAPESRSTKGENQ
jgi:DNA-binding NtrC family response regulator